jgi:hypothetical protein
MEDRLQKDFLEIESVFRIAESSQELILLIQSATGEKAVQLPLQK